MIEVIREKIDSLMKQNATAQGNLRRLELIKTKTHQTQNDKALARDNINRIAGALKAVRDLEKSWKPTFNEVDLQEYVEMVFILKKIESMQNKEEDTKLFVQKSKHTNKDIELISSLTPLFLWCKGTGTTILDVSTSHFGHLKSFLCNSTHSIEGRDVSYSEFRALIKNMKNSIFELSPLEEKRDIMVSFYHEEIGYHTPISMKRADHKFIISVTNTDGKVYEYGFGECFDNKFLSYKPYKNTLVEYIKSNPMSQKRKPLFGSNLLYPTRFVKGLIQGLLTAAVERIEGNNQHRYLVHPENILLHEPIHPPYPPCYFSHKINKNKEMMLLNANEKRQFIVPISFVNTVCRRQMEDIDAVKDLIFNTILEESAINPLPQEWKLFKNEFGNKNDPWHYEKISSSSVLWDWQKQLGLFSHARALIIHPEIAVRQLISPDLNQIVTSMGDWCTVAKNELPWNLVFNYKTKFMNGDLKLMLLFFRNLVEHINLGRQQHGTRAYLAYRIGCLFPSLVQQINKALIQNGLKY